MCGANNTWTCPPAINIISKKLRQINKLRTEEKRKTMPRKISRCMKLELQRRRTAKRIQRKQKSRVQVYRLAFYSVELHGGVYMATYFSMLHFGIFPTTSQLVVPTLICKSKTRCTITIVPKLICMPERTDIPGMTLRRLCIKAWIIYTWTNIDKAASYHANKQTKSTQFILHRARTWTRYVRRRDAWISVIFTL